MKKFISILLVLVVNENIQIVDMWISGEELSLLDNALITMEHLFKTGRVYIYLRHLMNESSYFEVRYSVDRNQEKEISFTLSMNEIDDHKRQLIFGSAGVEENIIYKRALINGQLKLFQTVEKIYTNLIKLELSGHPNYQSHEEQYDVHLHLSKNGFSSQEFGLNELFQVKLVHFWRICEIIKIFG